MNFGKQPKAAGTPWEKLKQSIYPSAKVEREKRMKQYRDLAIFVGSILIVSIFEDKIKNLLKVDKSEITQFSNMQQQMHGAY